MSGLSVVDAARDAPDAPAIIDGDRALTFAALRDLCLARVAALAASGVSPGDRVAVQASNRVEALVTLLAVMERGAVMVPIHPRLSRAERDVIVADASPALVLDDDALATFGEGASPMAPTPADDGALLAVVYTSGTTGRPKGATLTRRAFVESARASAANLGWRDDDRWLLCLPVCHVGGLSVVTRCLVARKPLVLLRGFDVDAVDDAVARHRCTLVSLVPTMLARVLDAGARAMRLPRAVLLGGAAATPSLLARAASEGVRVLVTYGLTEACSQVTTWSLDDPSGRRGVGRPLPGVGLRVVSDGDDPVGRVEVRGPTVSGGYWGHPPREGEWFDTGDLGWIDDGGALHVAARRTDLIVTGGENVYPAEVEAALTAHPEVAAAMVFGAPDDVWGQSVQAAVVAREGAVTDDAWREGLYAFVSEGLAGFKRPKGLAVVEALPTLSNGKPDRKAALGVLGPLTRPWGRSRG
ncbi:MAG: AMP-binding protein [Polyangiales bacterium]